MDSQPCLLVLKCIHNLLVICNFCHMYYYSRTGDTIFVVNYCRYIAGVHVFDRSLEQRSFSYFIMYCASWCHRSPGDALMKEKYATPSVSTHTAGHIKYH